MGACWGWRNYIMLHSGNASILGSVMNMADGDESCEVFNGHSVLGALSQSNSDIPLKLHSRLMPLKFHLCFIFTWVHSESCKSNFESDELSIVSTGIRVLFFFLFFCQIVIVPLEVTGLIAAVITSYPEAFRLFSDVHFPTSMSTGPLISQSIVAVGQIGLEAHHYHPALSLVIFPAGNYTRSVLLGETASVWLNIYFVPNLN